MSIWTSRPSTPAPAPRPGVPTPGKLVMPWSSKPVAKPAAKPVVKPGILGEHGFSSFLQMRGFAKKAPFAPAPTYGQKLTKQERIGMIKTLQKYSGQAYGLSMGKYNEVLNKMKKEKYVAGIKHDFKKAKDLDIKIKQLSAWEKAKK